jgi:hypothetical protein
MTPINDPWNSLEVIKLIAEILTPISVAVLGLYLSSAAKALEARQWASQKVVEKRIVVYDVMAPQLNALYCYMSCVGAWKDLTPPAVIEIKRKLDAAAYIYAPLFSPKFMEAYQKFIAACFETWQGEGHDARLRTSSAKHEAAALKAGKAWEPAWEALFAQREKVVEWAKLSDAYKELMECFSRELGVGLNEVAESSPRRPLFAGWRLNKRLAAGTPREAAE